MVCYSADPGKGFLSKEGIRKIKSHLAGQIFKQDLYEIYGRQTQQRDTLTAETRKRLQLLTEQLQSGTLENGTIGKLLFQLSQQLKHTSGKKQYGYLKAPLKQLVDEIVEELVKEPMVQEAFSLWYDLREEVLRTYRDDMPERLPLSKQKEFKQIKNMIIREAVRLGEETSQQGKNKSDETAAGIKQVVLLRSVSRLLHHLGKIFQSQTPPAPNQGPRFIDHKLKQKLRQKQQALGIKSEGQRQ